MISDSDKFIYGTPTSKIPTPISPFKRSGSFKVRGEKAYISSSVPTSTTIDETGDYIFNSSFQKKVPSLSFFRNNNLIKNCHDEDLDSIGSVASNFSLATNNSSCEHVNFAKNGTTFSGKTHKYIVHCSDWNEQEKYLTPTQRANRSIKKLKSLLQLAKEKLREKEEEIFKLNITVNELKLIKSGLDEDGTANAGQSTALSHKVFSDAENLSPKIITCGTTSKDFSDESLSLSKISLSPSQSGLLEKSSITSDFFLYSSADSGNFDDLTSITSLNSKISTSFNNSDGKNQNDEEADFCDTPENLESNSAKLVRMYEKKLMDKKLEYELELSRVMNEQEEKNIKVISEFEEKLKQEELKFETRWNDLLKKTEEEKCSIVNRFEEKLEEEKQKYMKNLNDFKNEGNIIGMTFEKAYSQNVEEEKSIYETSLMNIKKKFESEKLIIEEKFDEAMKEERNKFEESLKDIQQLCDSRVADLTQKVSQLKLEYDELLPKYEEVKSEKQKLEKENEFLKNTLKQQEECHRKIYLAFSDKDTVQNFGSGNDECNEHKTMDPEEEKFKKLTVSELSAQLKITKEALENLKAMYKRLVEAQEKSSKKEKSKSDPEATLQFLKSAVYYFLTDRENHIGHLKAIESILAFSSTEKSNIEKIYLNRY